METGLILLAAGASTRLGSPKQQLVFRGESLLQRAIGAARASVCTPVVVVLGAKAALLRPEVAGVQVAVNPNWEEGMASSIRCGLSALLSTAPPLARVVLMLCDQPFADAALLNRLVQEQAETGKGIVASAYGNTLGTPALFSSAYFTPLLNLQGKQGAKKLLLSFAEDVATVPFPRGTMDVDTPADYEALRQEDT